VRDRGARWCGGLARLQLAEGRTDQNSYNRTPTSATARRSSKVSGGMRGRGRHALRGGALLLRLRELIAQRAEQIAAVEIRVPRSGAGPNLTAGHRSGTASGVTHGGARPSGHPCLANARCTSAQSSCDRVWRRESPRSGVEGLIKTWIAKPNGEERLFETLCKRYGPGGLSRYALGLAR